MISVGRWNAIGRAAPRPTPKVEVRVRYWLMVTQTLQSALSTLQALHRVLSIIYLLDLLFQVKDEGGKYMKQNAHSF